VSPAADDIVYIVDDDDSVRRGLTRLVRAAGFDVEAFPSAEAFLGAKPPDQPACVVLDVRMPGQSGPELQDALGQAGHEIPIIFLTGHGDVAMSVRAMKSGAADFLEKPTPDHVLLAAIRRALDRDRQARTERAERHAIRARVDSLTPRERQVLVLVVGGFLNKQIGTELGATEKTIKVHRGRVMHKMRAGSLAELVRLAEKAGISPGVPSTR
jgi:FixJ family two-component response regulator